MPKRSLLHVLKLRQGAVDDARAALAQALAAEKAAVAAESAATGRIQAELRTAAAIDADDATVEALAAWLPEARARHRSAREQLAAAEAVTARARAVLTAACTAAAAVEALMLTRATEAQRDARRRDRAALQDQVLARPGVNEEEAKPAPTCGA